MKVSVIIPAINEPLLDWTVNNIKEIDDGIEIIVMEDKKHEGVGIMRDRGIKKASNDIVVIADAHMSFAKDCFEKMAQEIEKHSKHIACVCCPGLDEEKLKPNDQTRYGADLYEVMPGGDLPNPKIFVSRWRYKPEEKKTHPVPNILGGCYALSKQWYIEGLNAVWQYHRGWGKSEQMLALMNYYMGGNCVCIPTTWAAHLFRPNHTRAAENHGFFKRNTMLLLHGYVPEPRRTQLLNTFCPRNRPDTFGIRDLMADGSIKAVREWIETKAVRNYAFIRDLCKREKPTANYAATEKPRHCPACNSIASKVTKTYDLNRRKRECLDCGTEYPTFSAML